MVKLKYIVNTTCGLFFIALLLILLLHEGSFNSIRAVFVADAAIKDKYGDSSLRPKCRLVSVLTNKATGETIYTVEYSLASHHGTVEESYDGGVFNLLQFKEN